jgi:hypothetical protein
MDEPLALLAGLNFLSSLGDNCLTERIVKKMFGDKNCTPQHFGDLFEVLVAFQCLRPWWQTIPEDDCIWSQLPSHVRDHFKTLISPKQIINQRRKIDGGTDWSLANFQSLSDFFVLPDKNLGPDGLYDIMCFNCKTTQNGYVSSAECEKNYTKTDTLNWCKKDDAERKAAFQGAIAKKHLVFFQLEFPYSNPKNTRSFETNDSRTIIHLDLDSSITKYLLPEMFLSEWRSRLAPYPK